MKLHIANLLDSERYTVKAGEAIALGQVIVINNVAGVRTATYVRDAQASQLVQGKFGVAYKVSDDSLAVRESAVPADFAGSRVVTIGSGDLMVNVLPGAILEYDLSLLDASLDPARSGTLPTATAALSIKDGKFCAVGVSGAIASPIVGRVYDLLGGKVRVELLAL